MKGIGSDVTALAAVLGSAVVAGVVTLALAGGHSAEVAHECMVTEVEAAPRVVVALNSGHNAVVVVPEVRTNSSEVCQKVFFAQSHSDEHLEHTRADLAQAREGLERSRLRVREGLELRERLEFTDRVHLVERLELTELTERLERVERPERAEHAQRRERVARPERVEVVERVLRRIRDRGEEMEHEIGTTRVMVDGVAIELEGLGELLDLELEGLGEALELEFGGRAHLGGEMDRTAEEMDRVEEEMERVEEEMERAEQEMNRVDEELKRLIDELKRKRRRRGGGGR